jgi:hypothetical protein
MAFSNAPTWCGVAGRRYSQIDDPTPLKVALF